MLGLKVHCLKLLYRNFFLTPANLYFFYKKSISRFCVANLLERHSFSLFFFQTPGPPPVFPFPRVGRVRGFKGTGPPA